MAISINKSKKSQGTSLVPGESIKTPGDCKILIPEYQSNDIKNCLVLFPICQIRFSNLPGFNRLFLPVEIGDFLQKAPSENLLKTSENSKQKFPFVLLPSNNDSWMCSCILSSWENGIPLNKLFTLGGRLFNRPKRKHMLQRAESHHCVVNTFETFACNFSAFLRVSQRDSFWKSAYRI